MTTARTRRLTSPGLLERRRKLVGGEGARDRQDAPRPAERPAGDPYRSDRADTPLPAGLPPLPTGFEPALPTSRPRKREPRTGEPAP
ncbi:hypothetical protein [Streptomyces sp. NRRL B-3229]|uniref:hypothetical protein n=1 Tax=Streptomyces sp. NRRL B-3229 TaxID=1463836 RepID=UPI0004C0E0C8|nr:hypothetical protein [Streptomyces sp. NRRL B-3229]